MWRASYHILPEYGLINDPNGLIYYKGEYHVFYQWNPKECNHGAKYWAHMKSKDLVKWEKLPVALEPVDWFDKNGCYSGSAFEKDGKLYLFYTGNVKNDGVRESYQCLAVSEDGINFEKKGPVIHDLDIPKGYTRHFRDPKVFEKDGEYKMVIGAQRENLTGTIVVFSSKDLIKWNFEKEILNGEFGYMCECPDYIEDNKGKALLFSPQGLEAEGDLYNNRYQSGYIIRDLYDSSKNSFTELDRGFEFYAPQTFKDENGENTLFGWMGMPEELEHPSIEKENWVHMLTLPRTLEIKENKIYQRPHENLKRLRKEKIELKNILVDKDINLSNYGMKGECFELEIEVKDIKSDLTLKVRKGEKEETLFKYDYLTKKAIFDRENSGAGYKGQRRCKLEKLEKIHVFSDRSSLEIFLNDGEEVFTGNIYPKKESNEIELISEEKIIVEKIAFYNLVGGEE